MSEAGDTLIEVLLALVIIGLTVVSLLGAFTTSISASAVHKDEAQLDAVLKSFVEQTQQQLGRQTSPVLFESHCEGLGSGSTYASLTLTAGTSPVYTANLTNIKYWSSSGNWVAGCPDLTSSAPPAQQLLTATACRGAGPCVSTSPDSQSMDFAVADPAYFSNLSSAPVWCDPFSDVVAAGQTNTFLISTCNSGNPVPTITKSTTQPPPLWVLLQDNHDGTATLTFNPPSTITSQTVFSFGFVATNITNGTTNQVSVTFSLTVDVAPTFTSSSPTSANVSPGSINMVIARTSGSPLPTLSATGNPGTTTFKDNGDGTGTLTGTVAAGTYVISLGALNPVGSVSNTFTLTVSGVTNPTISFPTTTTPYNAGHNAGVETLHIQGMGFQTGLTVTANGVFTINSIVSVTPTLITVTLTGSGGQNATGSLTVTNPDGGTVTTTNSLINGGTYNG